MKYVAIIPVAGEVRRITFDAADPDDAKQVAAACHAGLEGEADPEHIPEAIPAAFGVQKTRELLGESPGARSTTGSPWAGSTGCLAPGVSWSRGLRLSG